MAAGVNSLLQSTYEILATNHSIVKNVILSVWYGFLVGIFFNITLNGFAPGQHTNGLANTDQGRGTLPFDHVFRSLHVVPTTLTASHHVPSYWTLDWVSHAAQTTGDNGAAIQPSVSVNLHSCMERNVQECFEAWTDTTAPGIKARCTTGDANPISFSCAMTANQTRYNTKKWISWDTIAGQDDAVLDTQQDVCADQVTNARRAACQMQRTNDLSLVVNDDKSFSVSSGHSQMVLLFYVSCILFIVQLFFLMSIEMVEKKLLDGAAKIGQKPTIVGVKKCVGLIFSLVILYHRIWYGNREQKAGMEVSTPNGTFFYGIVSYFVVMWFAASETEEREDEHETSFSRRSASQMSASENDRLMNPMELNVSAFNGNNKIKTKAFLQPGKGNYENAVAFHSDLNSNVKLTESAFDKKPRTSLWALTQLWVWPLLALSTLTVKGNYQLDINVTIVFAGTFVIGLIDLFERRLLELTKMYKNAIRAAMEPDTSNRIWDPSTKTYVDSEKSASQNDYSVDYGIRLVYIVGLLLQLMLFLLVFRTAGWSFFGSDVKNSAGWLVGAPDWYRRHQFIDSFTVLLSIYWLFTLIVKLLCLGPAEQKVWSGYEYFSGERWYRRLDGLNFFILNVVVVILLTCSVAFFAHKESNSQYYTAGVYVKAIAAKLT